MGKAVTLDVKKYGSKELRVVSQDGVIFGLIDGKIVLQGNHPDVIMSNLKNEVSKSNPKYFGFEGARNRFLHWFKGGFDSPEYVKEERAYRWEAKSRLDKHAPLATALTGSGLGPEILAAYQQTNLLSPFELMRMKDVLHGPKADEFVRAAARFAMGDLNEGLWAMRKALKSHEIAKWTAVTYLPFLWRPDTHMFLKPEVTKDYALRVGHSFADEYDAKLDLGGFRREVQPRRQHWFLNEKAGFPFRTPAFCSVFQGTKTARREGISSPFSDAGGCTSPQNSGSPSTRASSIS
jgi:hypothetical protein